ncbi:MAG: hypothetical protein KTR16_14315 [Acidiferrobacterales bacterium]|nr:hypothetical protein [Acidiferrobacterales bacterium]
MRTFIALMLWLLLFVVCWPVAILAIIAWPIVWLITLPFRLLCILFTGVFSLLTALITLPARLLGWKPQTA